MIGLIVAILGVAAIPAVSYSAAAWAEKKETKAEKLSKALKACKRDQLKSKRRACEARAKQLYGLHTPISKKRGASKKSLPTSEGEQVGAPAEGGAEEPTSPRRVGSAPCMGAHGRLCGEEPGTPTVPEAEELERARQASNMPTSTLVGAGQKIFAATCAACHGLKDEGTPAGPALNQPSLTRAQSVEGVMEQLINPVGGGMPNFRSELSLGEKEELGAYVCVDLTMKCVEAH